MRTLLLSMALLSLAGCKLYEGPNLGGQWDAVANVNTRSLSLELSHDPDAVLDHELQGTFVDARGTEWELEADPFLSEATVEARGEWRVTLRGGLVMVDDAGRATELDVGPLVWSLIHQVVHGEERITLGVKPVQRALGIDPPEGPWRQATFTRRRLPGQMPLPTTPTPTPTPTTPCAGCGEPLEARWQVCPVCARPRPAEGEPGR